MKVIVIVCSSILLLMGCNTQHKNKQGAKEEKTVDSSVKEKALTGIYKGIMPCADCEGIETTLKLNKDKSFVYTSLYIGKSRAVFEREGNWTIDGNVVNLSSVDYSFKVGENQMWQLDLSGNDISGVLADSYKLRKISE